MAAKGGDSSTREALRSALVRLHEADEKNAGAALPELDFIPSAHQGHHQQQEAGSTGLQGTSTERRLGSVSCVGSILSSPSGVGSVFVDLPGDRLAVSTGFSAFAGTGGGSSSGQGEKDAAARQAHKQNTILQGLYVGSVDKVR